MHFFIPTTLQIVLHLMHSFIPIMLGQKESVPFSYDASDSLEFGAFLYFYDASDSLEFDAFLYS